MEIPQRLHTRPPTGFGADFVFKGEGRPLAAPDRRGIVIWGQDGGEILSGSRD